MKVHIVLFKIVVVILPPPPNLCYQLLKNGSSQTSLSFLLGIFTGVSRADDCELMLAVTWPVSDVLGYHVRYLFRPHFKGGEIDLSYIIEEVLTQKCKCWFRPA